MMHVRTRLAGRFKRDSLNWADRHSVIEARVGARYGYRVYATRWLEDTLHKIPDGAEIEITVMYKKPHGDEEQYT